jgi:uncharacterized protein YjbI with pentapeptide repeats
MLKRGEYSIDGPRKEAIPDSRDLSERDLRAYDFPWELDLGHVNFNGSNLAGDMFWICDLSWTKFQHAFMKKTQLIACKMEHADLRRAYLHSAELLGLHLETADLRGADLTNALLSECYLSGTKLDGAVMRGARIAVDARGSDFSGVILDGADMRGSWFFSNPLHREDETAGDKAILLKNELDALYEKYKDHKNFDVLQAAIVDDLERVIFSQAHERELTTTIFATVYHHPLLTNTSVFGRLQELGNAGLSLITKDTKTDSSASRKPIESESQKKVADTVEIAQKRHGFFARLFKSRKEHDAAIAATEKPREKATPEPDQTKQRPKI